MDESTGAADVLEAEATARAAHEAVTRGDFDALRELLAEDVVWHASGDEAVAGTYHGRDAVIEALRAQRDVGEIDLADLAADAEPDVVGFAFSPTSATSTLVTTRARAECAKDDLPVTSIMEIQQRQIMSFGTLAPPRLAGFG